MASEASQRASRRAFSLLILVAGGLAAFWFSREGPREQHLRVVLGDASQEVTGLAVAYEKEGGETVREARFSYGRGTAPRVVSHDPSLPDGPYRLRFEVDVREDRRTVERQVTLGGGSTQVDLSTALTRKAP